MAGLTSEEWLAQTEKNRRFMKNVRVIRMIPALPANSCYA